MNGICGNEFQPSLRDLLIGAENPALKRRAIFGNPFGMKNNLPRFMVVTRRKSRH
jgi:hypothetical protein